MVGVAECTLVVGVPMRASFSNPTPFLCDGTIPHVPMMSNPDRTVARNVVNDQSQKPDRITARYCLMWDVNPYDTKHPISCGLSVTAEDGLMTLHDTREPRMKMLGGVDAVTLGGVGDIHDVDQLLHSITEWEGPKVRAVL